MTETTRPLSPYWQRVRERAQSDVSDWSLSAAGNAAASLMFHASRPWNGDPGYFGPGLLARLMGCDHREAGSAFREVVSAGLAEVVEQGDFQAKTSTKVRWVGPG